MTRRLRDCYRRDATPWDEPTELELRARSRDHSSACDCRFCEARQAEAEAEYDRRKERQLFGD